MLRYFQNLGLLPQRQWFRESLWYYVPKPNDLEKYFDDFRLMVQQEKTLFL